MTQTTGKALLITVLLGLLGASDALATGFHHPPQCPDCVPTVLPDCYWTVDFTVSYRGADYYGKVLYVDDNLTGNGYEALAIDPLTILGHGTRAGLLGVEFNFKGQTFDQCDDVLYDEAPVAVFDDGAFKGLRFAFKSNGDLFSITMDKFTKNFRYKGEVTYASPIGTCAAIPTPAAASGGLALLASFAFRRRIA